MTSATGAADLHGPLFAIKMLGLLLLLDAALTVSGAWPTGPSHRAATLQLTALVRTCTPIADTSCGRTGRSPAQGRLVARGGSLHSQSWSVGEPHGVPRIVHAARQRSRTPPPMPSYTHSANPLSWCARPKVFVSYYPIGLSRYGKIVRGPGRFGQRLFSACARPCLPDSWSARLSMRQSSASCPTRGFAADSVLPPAAFASV